MSLYQKSDAFFKETQLESQSIFEGKVLHVCRDTIRLPNGKTSVREYCKHKGAVCIVPLTDDGKVICVRQYRYALGRVVLEIPAGKLDSVDEIPESAARRELEEETGRSCLRLTSIGNLNTSPALLTEVIYMYLAEGLSNGMPHPDEDEFLEIVEIPLETLVDMILAGEILDSKTQAAILKVWAMKQKEVLSGT